MTDLHDRLAAAQSVAAAVGELALDYFQRRHQLAVETKGITDYVSVADRAAEQVARDALGRLFPDDAILGEESGGALSGSSWVIDPIDGTTNFLNGLPIWAVSVAYLRDGVPLVGAIALPALGMLFSAAQGGPLRLGNEVRQPPANCEARLAGIGRNPAWLRSGYRETETRLDAAGYTLVSLGSCAAELAFTADGRLGGYVQHRIRIWDAAAGIVLCRAAGLEFDWHPVGASTGDLCTGGPDFMAVARSRP